MDRFFTYVVVLFFCFGWSNCTGSKILSPPATLMQKTGKQTGIQWVSLEELSTLVQQQPKKTFIKVYTNWCGWCKKLDATTLATPEIVHYINKHFYPVKFDGESKKPVILNEKRYRSMHSESSRSGHDHQLTSFLLGDRRGYPTTVFLAENLTKIQSLSGYKTPQDLDAILHYYAEDIYKENNNSLTVYEMNFESKIKK